MSESAQILIVDDDVRICRLLSRYLLKEGFAVNSACDGTAMWALLEDYEPDLILLDLMLPGVDGIALARELRAKTHIGIIMVTGKNNPVDTIVGLEVGADDYVTKPFDNRELLARIRSVLRRTSQHPATVTLETGQTGETCLIFNGWRMKLDSFELTSPGGELVRLTNHEFRLLEILVKNSGHVLSRDQILHKLSRRDWQSDDRSVDVLIAKLRKIIENNPAQPKLIRTIRSVGYQFTGNVQSE